MRIPALALVLGSVALFSCGGGDDGPTTGPTLNPLSASVGVYDVDQGRIGNTTVMSNNGVFSFDAASLASTYRVQSDNHLVVRAGGSGIGSFRVMAGDNTVDVPENLVTENEQTHARYMAVFLRRPGPSYNLVEGATLRYGRSISWGFSSEPGIVGPRDFWPTVFDRLSPAFVAEDGTSYIALQFNANNAGNFTVGFGDEDHQATGYRHETRTSVHAYVLGSNSHFPLDYVDWTNIGTGIEEVWEAVLDVNDIADSGSSYPLLVNRKGEMPPGALTMSRYAAIKARH